MTIQESFESINVWLFPPPVANTAGLSEKIRFNQLQPQFRNTLRDLRKKLTDQLKQPMLFNNKALTARRVNYLLPELVKVLVCTLSSLTLYCLDAKQR